MTEEDGRVRDHQTGEDGEAGAVQGAATRASGGPQQREDEGERDEVREKEGKEREANEAVKEEEERGRESREAVREEEEREREEREAIREREEREREKRAEEREVTIQIDRVHYMITKFEMTGADLRQLPAPPIGPDRDLFEVVPGGTDIKIGDALLVELHNGMRFFTAPAQINPGRAGLAC